MTGGLLPDDDHQARYFGLVALALGDIAVMQQLGYITTPRGELVIEDDELDEVKCELHMRGFVYTDEEIARKGMELTLQWADSDRDVLPHRG